MARETTWEDDDSGDFTHMTPKGARKAGEYLSDKLMEACPDMSDTP